MPTDLSRRTFRSKTRVQDMLTLLKNRTLMADFRAVSRYRYTFKDRCLQRHFVLYRQITGSCLYFLTASDCLKFFKPLKTQCVFRLIKHVFAGESIMSPLL